MVLWTEVPSGRSVAFSSAGSKASAEVPPTTAIDSSSPLPESVLQVGAWPPSSSDKLAEPNPDAAPPTATARTVDEAINACLLADPRLKAGLEVIQQANGGWVQSTLKPNPSLNVGQTLMPLTSPFTVTKQGGPPQLDIGMAMPFDWYLFGKRAAAMLSAQQAVRVSESEYADLIRQRVLQTSRAYYDAVEA